MNLPILKHNCFSGQIEKPIDDNYMHYHLAF